MLGLCCCVWVHKAEIGVTAAEIVRLGLHAERDGTHLARQLGCECWACLRVVLELVVLLLVEPRIGDREL